MLPSTLPLFPLPNVVLFPGVFLPLHIFEARYRAMTEDALAGDRMIGMALLKPGFEAEYEGRPPIYPVGCVGLITHAERLPDGRFHIVLQGVERFRVVDEDHSRVYRLGLIERLGGDIPSPSDTATLRALRDRIEHLLVPLVDTRRRVDRAADDDRRRRHPRAGAVPGPGADRKAGAARVRHAGRARGSAGRSARR